MTKANQTASIKKFGMFWEGPKGFLLSSLYVPQAIAVGFVLAVVAIGLLYWYFGTEQGSAMRATGSNPAMSRAQGIHIETMKVIGLGLSNGMVALAGGLMTQYQGTADVSKMCIRYSCGCLALMNDFGTAIIFFVAFLVIAFLRSGDVATLALACAGTGFAGVLALRFKPYALKRFSAWGHVWENALTTGYSQTRACLLYTSRCV